jgi:hypothetical protein
VIRRAAWRNDILTPRQETLHHDDLSAAGHVDLHLDTV